MIRNYFKTAFRNFKRHKSSFLINVIGLSIGMACSILILLWVMDELQYDRFHEDIDQVYRVMEHQTYSDDIMTTSSTPGILAPELKQEIPEIEYATTYTWNNEFLFTRDQKSFRESGIFARPDLFYILSIPLVSGDKATLLDNPHSVVISEEMAEKYFGSEDPVGKSILINSEQVHQVTGVFKKIPDNSSIQFDYVLPFEDWLKHNEWATRWGNNGPRSLVKLHAGVDVAALNIKLKDFIKERNDDDSNVDLFVYPYADLYLYGQFEDGKVAGGRIDYVHLFSIVAIFILIIACINFMNLSTAKAANRAKEVGVRKSIGASKGSLIAQFIGESMMLSFFSLLIAIVLVALALPGFNDLTEKSMEMHFTSLPLLLLFAGTVGVTGLLAGSYPAFYLSSFDVVKTLKGSLKSSRGETFARKGLVIFQFAISIILIVSTIVVYKQIQFTQSKNLGYDKENLIYFTVENEIDDNWEPFRQQVMNVPGVANISRSSTSFLGRNSNTSGVEWPGKDSETEILFENMQVDYGLLETMGFELAAGRFYSRDFGADTSRIILNETAIDIMDMENPVGKTITLWDVPREIIGVVKDFNYQNLRYEVAPLFFILNPDNTWRAFVRIRPEDIPSTIAGIQDAYKKFNTNYPFNYEFMDQQYAALYRSEMRIGTLAKYFSLFAILISCLGLFGLSAFTAEQRSKEIGVRKVLGASVRGLVFLLTRDFTELIIIAILIGLPVSWFLMNQWIGDFAYQTSIEWWIFAAAGLLALFIAWVTVSWQSIRAALANPVDSLRSE